MSKRHDIIEDKSDSISDDSIRRSLLGSADSAEQASFEELLMRDDQFSKRVHRLEVELADDFTFERLSAQERELFTDHFLVTSGRARELAVSQALRRAVADKSFSWAGQTNLGWRSKLLSLFALDRPFAKVALAASALLFFGTLFWLILKAPKVSPALITKRQQANSGEEYAHPVASRSPADQLTGHSGSTQPQVVATITVRPGNQADGKVTVQLPTSTSESDRLRLRLLVADAAEATYQAILISESGTEVTSFSQLAPDLTDSPKVVLDVPANLLSIGNYYIDLKRSSEGEAGTVQRYSFEVKKE